jgi:ABC-type transport system involved in multi-copper enzyme maturation permease subunit
MLAILRRELIAILRTRKAFVLQLGVALCFVGLIALRWPTDGRVDLSGARSGQVFGLFSYGLLAAVALLAPVFPATSIVTERRKGTLALLLNSPLRAWSIYAGKWFGVLGFIALLLVLTLPAAAACYAMGGISLTNQLLAVYGLLLVAAVLYISLGLLVSSLANSADGAVRVTYGCVLALAVLTLAPYFFLQQSGGLLSELAAWIRCVSPVPAMMEIVGHGDVGSEAAWKGPSAVARFMLLAPLLAALFSGITISRLRYHLLDRARSQGLITDNRSLGTRAARRAFFIVDPNRRSRNIGNWVNPVMAKEFRSRRFGRSHWMLRLIGGCAILSLFLAFTVTTGTVQWDLESVGGPLVLLQVGLMVVFMPSLAAGLISSEQENNAWPLLRTSPLSGGRIVRGKLLSALWTMLLMLLATLPGYAVMIYIQPTLWLQVVRAFVCLFLAGLMALMISAMVGSWFRKTAAATTAAYVAVLGLFGGTLLIWLARDAPFGFQTVENALKLNPMAAALSVFNLPGFRNYQLIPVSWWVAGVVIVICFLVMRFRVQSLTRPE